MSTIYVVVSQTDEDAGSGSINIKAYADRKAAQAHADRLNTEMRAHKEIYRQWVAALEKGSPQPTTFAGCSNADHERLFKERQAWIQKNPVPMYQGPGLDDSEFILEELEFEP